MPFIVSTFGIILSVLMGMAVTQLSSIRACVTRLNDQFFKHLTNPVIHEAAVAKIGEQLKSVEQIAKAAHHRLDSLSGNPGLRGLTGPVGRTGSKGEQGQQGERGEQGEQR